jgi:hypothetical protein
MIDDWVIKILQALAYISITVYNVIRICKERKKE